MNNICNYILCLSAILFACTAMAQNPQTVRTVVNQGKDSTVTFQVLHNSQNITTENELTYYWEQYDVIHTNKGGFTGNLLHGKYNVTNHKGQLVKKGQFYNGTRHAEWTEWDNNGEIISQSVWDKGILKERSYENEDDNREHIYYAKNEEPLRKTTIINGVEKQYKYVNGQWVEKKGLFKKIIPGKKQQ